MDYPILPDLCLDASGYDGEKDYVNTYLGFDRFMKVNPQVTLQAIFESDEATDGFFRWWKEATQEGYLPFIVTATLFGKKENYGVRQISSIKHTSNKFNTISFRVEVLFRTDLLGNAVPEALGATTYVGEDTRDNFIFLKGIDPEGDPLTFDITLPPANGVLSGTPPNLLYTPNAGYEGSDCFNFTVSDRFQTSSYATVEIVVGGEQKATAQFDYLIDPVGIRVTGNYHYRQGRNADANPIIRGAGGLILSNDNDGFISIWSDDHRIDKNDITNTNRCEVIDWGKRKNYESFLDGAGDCAFVSNNAIGTCVGTIFINMFRGTIGHVTAFDTSSGVYFNGMFEEYGSDGGDNSLPTLDLSNGLYFDRMFKNSNARFHRALNTSKGQYFKEMLHGSHYGCIPSIDTTRAINLVNMFGDNPNKVHPNDAEISDVLSKMAWVSPETCGLEINGIILDGATQPTCEIATIGGSCTSTATYKVDITAGTIPTDGVSYQWYLSVSDGTVVGSSTEPSFTVDIPSDMIKVINIRCEVTNNYTFEMISIPFTKFTHERSFAYPVLTLPSYSQPLTLEEFIIGEIGSGHTGEVEINNYKTNCQLKTGDLSQYSLVYMKNRGALQAHSRGDGEIPVGGWEECALYATSAITIDNGDGFILACGGKGGEGGKGADFTYHVNRVDSRYNIPSSDLCTDETYCWRVAPANETPSVRCYWDGCPHWYSLDNLEQTGPVTSNGQSGLYRGNYKGSFGGADWYAVERRYSTIELGIGGDGGEGGKGIGYGMGGVSNGGEGGDSNPAGNNRGGNGGYGGDWGEGGQNGLKGDDQTTENGKAGLLGGKAIIGDSFITWINQGTIKGEVV